MTTEFSGTEKAAKPLQFFESNTWNRLQNLISRIISVNVSILSPEGVLLGKPSETTLKLSELVVPVKSQLTPEPPDFVLNHLEQLNQKKKRIEVSKFGVHYFLLPLIYENQILASFMIGPMLIGKRETENRYRELCGEWGIDSDIYADHIRSIRLYSYLGINSVLDFLSEMAQTFFEKNILIEEITALEQTHVQEVKGMESLLSLRYGHELANTLLEIARSLVQADTGSVLIFDDYEKCFQIQASYGLPFDIVREARISRTDSLAGFIAERGKSTLLQKNLTDRDLEARFINPKIHSSFVIPMKFHDQVIGLLCLNSFKSNAKFNQDNLVLVDQLSKIASIAFARLGEN